MTGGDELTPQQRAARATRLFYQGRRFTTSEMADEVGLTQNGAWRMLCNISREVPISDETPDQRWELQPISH